MYQLMIDDIQYRTMGNNGSCQGICDSIPESFSNRFYQPGLTPIKQEQPVKAKSEAAHQDHSEEDKGILKVNGEWKDDKANGYGVYFHGKTGAKYQGYWQHMIYEHCRKIVGAAFGQFSNKSLFFHRLQYCQHMQNSPFNDIFLQAHNLLSTYQPKKTTLLKHLETHRILQKLAILQIQNLDLPDLTVLPEGIYARTPIQKHKIRLSLYYMSAGRTMTLHNHPGMIVVSFVISGKMRAKYYTLLNTEMIFRKQQAILEGGSFSCIDGLRSMQRNLHELRAEQSSLFLDIICPDYNQSTRLCRYFQEDQQVGDNLWKLKQIEDDLLLNDL